MRKVLSYYGNYLGLDGNRLVKAYQNQVGEVDTFTIRPIMRQKKQETINSVQSEYVEHQMASVAYLSKRDKRSVNGPLNKNVLCLLLLLYSWCYF